jgi:predicted ATPase
MLVRLYIDNYACFVNFEFRPAQTNLLIGDNGSGKTTILNLLGQIIQLNRIGTNVDVCFPQYSRTAWDPRDKQTFEIDVDLEGELFKYVLEVAHEKDLSGIRTFIAREELTLTGKPLFRFVQGRVELFKDDHNAGPSFEFSNKRSFLANVELSNENRRLIRFLNWLTGIWRFHLDPTSIKNGSIAEREAMIPAVNGENFAAFFRYLVQERPEVTERVQNALQDVIPGFERMRLISVGNERKGLYVNFISSEDASKYQLPFVALSDGQVTLIVLYTILHALSENSSLLFVDEPDNFVALREIQPWLQELSDHHEIQAIIISHNPEVIDYLAADTTFLLSRRTSGLARIEEVKFLSEGGLKASEQIARGL